MTRLSHPRVRGATYYLSQMPVTGDHWAKSIDTTLNPEPLELLGGPGHLVGSLKIEF